ncbi:hypothetical protein CFPU101_44960 [Chroococcus sp. FPU101]|nr:hypothetical protein CFPU101_44960 [Chroococcus sp. FPU101]
MKKHNKIKKIRRRNFFKMSEKPKSKPECPIPKEMRETIKETAEVVDKHKQVIRKISPFHL